MLLEIQSRFGSYQVVRYRFSDLTRHLPEPFVWIQDEKLPPLLPQAILLPSGEELKSEKGFGLLMERLQALHVCRKTTLVVLGGGSVLDLVGFLAHTYHRGLDWISIPSTVLAQADSCIGGKTAINWGGLKNQIGAFHPPSEVRLCAELLDSLPLEARIDGIAEIFKSCLIESPEAAWAFMEDFETQKDVPLNVWIEQALRLKARLIQEDEMDHGVRQHLNLGHTIGHALESCLGLSHGKAVAWGMALVFGLSHELGYTSFEETKRVQHFLKKVFGFQTFKLGHLLEEVCERIKKDKKRGPKGLAWVLPKGIGQVELVVLSDWERWLQIVDKKVRDL
jgi:3-dehydroquinate synthase